MTHQPPGGAGVGSAAKLTSLLRLSLKEQDELLGRVAHHAGEATEPGDYDDRSGVRRWLSNVTHGCDCF